MSISPTQESILLLGDSLTQEGLIPGGISQRLSDAYPRKLDVVNRGFSGYNTEWLLPAAEQIVAAQGSHGFSEIALMVVWMGANDAVIPESPSGQHVPLDRFKSNLADLLSLPKSTNAVKKTRTLLLTPPPVQPERWAAFINLPEHDRTVERTREYAEAVVEVGKNLTVPVLDVHSLIEGHGEAAYEEIFLDGLHFTPAGYKIVFDALMKLIVREWPELNPNSMKMAFPSWDTIDRENPRGSFALRTAEKRVAAQME